MIYILLFFYEAIVCSYVDRLHFKNMNGIEIEKNKFRIFPKKIISILFVSIPMICVMGLRYKIGVDYDSYESIFYWIRRDNGQHGMEYLYYVLNSCIGRLTDNPQWLFFAVSILINILLVKGIVKSGGSLYYGILSFMGLGYWFYSMTTQRQWIACMIAFCGWKYLEQKNFKKFLPYIIIATMFHSSAIILVAIYLFLKFVKGKRFYYISFIMILSMTLFKAVVLYILQKLNFYSVYMSKIFISRPPSWVNIIISGTFMIASGIFYNNLIQIRKENETRVKIVWICLLSHLFLWSYGEVALRMIDYLNLVYILLISDIARCFSLKNGRIIQISLCVLLCCFMVIIITYPGNGMQHFLPYRYRPL